MIARILQIVQIVVLTWFVTVLSGWIVWIAWGQDAYHSHLLMQEAKETAQGSKASFDKTQSHKNKIDAMLGQPNPAVMSWAIFAQANNHLAGAEKLLAESRWEFEYIERRSYSLSRNQELRDFLAKQRADLEKHRLALEELKSQLQKALSLKENN